MTEDIPPYCLALRDRYTFERELGRGGMAIVWLARERRYDRRVAVKFLRPELASVMGQDRFVREIRYAAGLSHPNILPLLDSGSLPDDSVLPGLPYYVMPFVDGESLRDRLARERSLPIPDALEIVKNVAAALDHAHARNLIHRDIKPGNILLTGDVAVVADFGIARAADRAVTSEERTSEGLALGTAQYMPPEQVDAQPDLDGRADIYALGCVLYEMLAGDPPFTGSTPAAVMARQRFDPPPSIRTVRDTVPLAVERAVAKALAKQRVDRFATAGEFARALTQGSGEQPAIVAPPVRRAPSRGWRFAGAAVATITIAVLVPAVREFLTRFLHDISSTSPPTPRAEGAVDSTRYAVLPFVYAPEVTTPLLEDQVIRDALARWDGITVADPFQVRDALARLDLEHAALTSADAGAAARVVGAGRFVRGLVVRQRDSIRVSAGLYDLATNRLLAERAVWLPTSLAGLGTALRLLADSLLLRVAVPGPDPPSGESSSLPALQAFARGTEAVKEWDLAAAESAFASALEFDPEYGHAALWLALIRRWARAPVAAWQPTVARTLTNNSQLGARDRAIVTALSALAGGRVVEACQRWDSLARGDASDFVTWYGLADCLRRDTVVIRHDPSPSGWRFRSSSQAALDAHRQAFELLPAMHRGLRFESYFALRRIFYTDMSMLRSGRPLPPDTGTFLGYAATQGDSLLFVPYRTRDVIESRPAAVEAHRAAVEAVRRQRRLFLATAQSWMGSYPKEAGPHELLAIAQEMVGDPAAIATIRGARRLATTPADSIRLAAIEIRLLVKLGLQFREPELRAAKALADSTLARAGTGAVRDPFTLAGVASVTGRAATAARLLSQTEAAEVLRAPGALALAGPPLLLWSAMGGPRDSIRIYANRTRSTIENNVAPADRPRLRLEWLARAAALSWPPNQWEDLPSLAGSGDFLVDAIARVEQHDSAGALQDILDRRASLEAAGVRPPSLDALHTEAALLAALHRPDIAAELLERALTTLYGSGPEGLDDPLMAAVLVRCVALRADLASQAGDPETARRWARLAVILWSDADPYLAPVVRRMAALAR
ncbi:MAG: serine/threonine-protein kinase [Gemmatimonadales bacterium]